MKICQKCEAEVKEDEDTCPRCGSKDLKEEKFCRILGTKLNWKRKKNNIHFSSRSFPIHKAICKAHKVRFIKFMKTVTIESLKKI